MASAEQQESGWTFETTQLVIRPAVAESEDVAFLYQLWTDPEVMRFVGFPKGLRTSLSEIKAQLEGYGPGEFDRTLIVFKRQDGVRVGECKLGSADEEGIAHTDVKLLPKYQGMGYGKEIKQALLDYLFTQTTCSGVRATPNQLNAASIRMQESVGGRRIKEGVHSFPEQMREFTCDVPYVEYVVFRKEWERDKPSTHRQRHYQ